MTAITEFLRQQKKAGSPRRRVQRQKEWLDAVEGLLRHIRSWLAEAQREKLIKIHPDRIKITEENLGTYSAPCLILTAAGKTVKVGPIGSTRRAYVKPHPHVHALLFVKDISLEHFAVEAFRPDHVPNRVVGRGLRAVQPW